MPTEIELQKGTLLMPQPDKKEVSTPRANDLPLSSRDAHMDLSKIQEIIADHSKLSATIDQLRLERAQLSGQLAELRITIVRLEDHLEHYRKIAIEQDSMITNLYQQISSFHASRPNIHPEDLATPNRDPELSRIAQICRPKKEGETNNG